MYISTMVNAHGTHIFAYLNMEEGLFPLQISINASMFWPVKEMLNCNYLASHSTVCDQIPLSRKLLPLRALLLGKHDNEQ